MNALAVGARVRNVHNNELGTVVEYDPRDSFRIAVEMDRGGIAAGWDRDFAVVTSNRKDQ